MIRIKAPGVQPPLLLCTTFFHSGTPYNLYHVGIRAVAMTHPPLQAADPTPELDMVYLADIETVVLEGNEVRNPHCHEDFFRPPVWSDLPAAASCPLSVKSKSFESELESALSRSFMRPRISVWLRTTTSRPKALSSLRSP